MLSVALLDTGGPIPDSQRAGPATLVAGGPEQYLVDAGRGVLMRLAAVGSGPAQLGAVLLTHLHSGHDRGGAGRRRIRHLLRGQVAAGVTTGVTPTMFNPEGLVTRAQMAAFLCRLVTTAAYGASGAPTAACSSG